jgi:protein ImuA
MRFAFPNAHFPLGAIHEFLCEAPENAAATAGFISGLIASLIHKQGSIIWIISKGTIFPPALLSYGLSPEKIIFIRLEKEKQILWTLEEALKCKGLSAVVGELGALPFTESRKLQLAVEQSGVTGFVIRRNESNITTTACVTRWKIHSLPSQSIEGLPGVGHPAWNIHLQKVRNGKPGSWEIEWASGKFRPLKDVAPLLYRREEKKTG